MNPTLEIALKNPERMAKCEVCKKEIPTHKGKWVGYDNEYFLCSSQECEDSF